MTGCLPIFVNLNGEYYFLSPLAYDLFRPTYAEADAAAVEADQSNVFKTWEYTGYVIGPEGVKYFADEDCVPVREEQNNTSEEELIQEASEAVAEAMETVTEELAVADDRYRHPLPVEGKVLARRPLF